MSCFQIVVVVVVVVVVDVVLFNWVFGVFAGSHPPGRAEAERSIGGAARNSADRERKIHSYIHV